MSCIGSKKVLLPLDYVSPQTVINTVNNSYGNMDLSINDGIVFMNQGIDMINSYGFQFPYITEAKSDNSAKVGLTDLYTAMPRAYFYPFMKFYLINQVFISTQDLDDDTFAYTSQELLRAKNMIVLDKMNAIDSMYKTEVKSISLPTRNRKVM